MAGRFAKLIGKAILPRRRRSFARDESGVTAVEFGLLALPFFSIIGAIIETSLVFLSGQILDSSVQDISRLIRTGQAQEANISAASFKQRICDRLHGLFADCNALHVEVRVLNSFTTANMAAPVNLTTCTAASCAWTRPESYNLGQGSSIVLVQVYYRWPVILNLGDLTLANLPDGSRLLGAATVFRNEPFT